MYKGLKITPFEGFDLYDYYDYYDYCKGFEITCKLIGYTDESEIMDSQENVYTRPSVLPIFKKKKKGKNK